MDPIEYVIHMEAARLKEQQRRISEVENAFIQRYASATNKDGKYVFQAPLELLQELNITDEEGTMNDETRSRLMTITKRMMKYRKEVSDSE